MADLPTRVPIRQMAAATAFLCVIAQVVSQMGGVSSGAYGPWTVVIGQAIWNGAQVGLLLLLLSLWSLKHRGLVVVLAMATLACLPFAVYAVSPGAQWVVALILATCALSWSRGVTDLCVSIVDAPALERPVLTKLEFLALVCNLLCSIYNFDPNQGVPPFWNSLFVGVSNLTGFTADLPTINQAMFSLSIEGVRVPAYILVGSHWNNLGSIAFVAIWTILPGLYVLYFALLAHQARHSPGTRIQQALCAVAIIHFLFLTDLVDYRFGRGIANPLTHGWHMLEVFVWRLAIILPVYQKLMSGQWLRGHGRFGVVMHYVVGAWTVCFFLYEVVLYDCRWLYAWATGTEFEPFTIFGRGYSELAGWHGALVLMIGLYAFMVLRMNCKRIVVRPAPTTQNDPPSRS